MNVDYDYIKTLLKSGMSAEDLLTQVRTMTDEAAAELHEEETKEKTVENAKKRYVKETYQFLTTIDPKLKKNESELRESIEKEIDKLVRRYETPGYIYTRYGRPFDALLTDLLSL